MKSNFQLLLDHLQQEHDYLEENLNACIQVWDFEGAEAFRRPLIEVRKKLRTLRNIDDHNFDRATSLRKQMKQLDNLNSRDDMPDYLLEIMKLRRPDYQAELSELEKLERKLYLDDDTLLAFLHEVCARTIIAFALEIETEQVQIEAEYLMKDLKLIISRTDDKSLDYSIGKTGLTELKKIGFDIQERAAVISVDNYDEYKILPTLEIIARVIYDVFGLYGDRDAVIKYK